MRPVRWRSLVLMVCLSCWTYFVPPTLNALDAPLRIASFNIQVFGQSKISNTAVTQILVRILDRYDLIFVQEIRDSNNSALQTLLQELNQKSSKEYAYAISERLGRSVSKEQYAFIYNTQRVETLATRTFVDSADDFEREPFIGHFLADGMDFSIIGIHVTPRDVANELYALDKVYQETTRRLDEPDVLIMGDLNADCSYYNPSQGFQFFETALYEVLPADTDTTLAPRRCTYDRIFAFGDELPRRAAQGAAFDFQAAYGLSMEEAREVSDHFPVEFSLMLSAEHEASADYEATFY